MPCTCPPVQLSNYSSRQLEEFELEHNSGMSIMYPGKKAADEGGSLVERDRGVDLVALHGEGYSLKMEETEEEAARKPLCRDGRQPGRWLNFSEWQADTCHYRCVQFLVQDDL